MSLLNRAPPREDAELNLIPLIDVMSVLVTFLLIYTADVEVVQNNKGIEIPQSTAETQASPSVIVTITKEHIFVQGEVVASIADVTNSQAPRRPPPCWAPWPSSSVTSRPSKAMSITSWRGCFPRAWATGGVASPLT